MARKKKNRLKVSKSILSLLVAGTIAVGSTGLIGTLVLKHHEAENPKAENSIGHSDFGLVTAWALDDKDFVILDIGDHDTIETHFQDKKITYLNEHDISLGVIVSTSAEKEADIYDDVEYVKSVLKEYKVDFPVYIDVNGIMENDNLNLEMKTKLIKTFSEKCAANGIYIGMYGTDTNLTRVREYCNIKELDAYLVMDKEEVEYQGTYNVYKDLDGKIKSKQNLAEVITTSGLNTEEKFANDGSYFFKEGDDLTDIALKYGMSVNELLKFNNLSKKDVVAGTKLRIPSIIDATIPLESSKLEKLDEPIRGADISYAQGTNIDWNKMEENFEFLILRVSQGTDLDDTFEENARNANLHDIPIGVYCFNNYTNNNTDGWDDFVRKQTNQADFVMESLKNKKIEYPVYFDLEAPNGVDLSTLLTKEQVNEMIDIWIEKTSENGYRPGLYCNQSTFRFIQTCISPEKLNQLEKWIAGGDQYYGETRSIDLEDVKPSSVLDKDYGATMAQSTDSAINSGAGNSKGHVDVNFSTVDYANQKTVYENEIYDIKDFERTDLELMAMFTGAGAMMTAIAGGLIFGKKKNKHHKRH